MARKKHRSAAMLRKRVEAWCYDRGATLVHETTAHADGWTAGGTLRLPLTVGALLVHLPSDVLELLSLCTRFVDGAAHPTHGDVNQHSGKWNFHSEDEAALFRTFASHAERLPLAHPGK